MVKVVLVGRRQSKVTSVKDLYFIKDNCEEKIPEIILLKITAYGQKIHFLYLQLIHFCSF